MSRIPVIPKTKETTLTVNNIVFDPSLKTVCMHDVYNLKYVVKLECLSHKPLFFGTFCMWFNMSCMVFCGYLFSRALLPRICCPKHSVAYNFC